MKLDSQTMINLVNSTDADHLAEIVNSMTENGWQGRPVIIANNANEGYEAITGSHRITAAKETGTNIEAIVFEIDDYNWEILECKTDEDRLALMEELLENNYIDENIVKIMREEF